MSYLITGGTLENRQQKALEMAKNQFHASIFDTIIIAGESSIGIEQIRELGHQLNLKPYNSETKAAIIHPGEILTLEAQSALLKTLEEPNQSSILILTAPQTDFLLPTIVSRCQIIRLETKPEIELDEKSLSTFYLLLATLLNDGLGERLKFASTFKNKEEIKNWLTKMLYFFREILLTDSGHLPAEARRIGGAQAGARMTTTSRHSGEAAEGERLQNQILNQVQDDKLTPIQVVQIIRNLEKTRNLLDQNINHKLALEIFLLDLPKVSTQSTPGVE